MRTIGLEDAVYPEVALPSSVHARRLLLLAGGDRLSRIVEVLVELGVADVLGDTALPLATLAEQTGAHADALGRVLRAAASVGVFAEVRPATFANSEVSQGLRSDDPRSVLPLVQYYFKQMTRRPYDRLRDSVLTGRPTFEHVHGHSFFDYLEEHRADRDFFESFMAHFSRVLVRTQLPHLGMDRFARLADLGGGDGWFLGQVLRAHPGGTGVLVELPQVSVAAETVLTDAGVRDRVTIVAGSIFTDPLPTDCDAYLLKGVLHNWSDEDAVRLLTRVRSAIGDRPARLLVWDQVMAGGNEWDHAKFLDVDMLVLFGGVERTLERWHELFSSAGLRLDNSGSGWVMMEAVPV